MDTAPEDVNVTEAARISEDAKAAEATAAESADEKAAPAASASAPKSAGGAVERKTGRHESVSVRPDPDNPDMVIIRTRKKKRKKKSGYSSHKSKMNPKLRVFLIVLAVIVGLLAAAGIALAIAVHVGNVNLHKALTGLQDAPEELKVENEGQTIEYEGHTYRYNENIVSFLIIGHDDESSFATREGASCADLNVLVTLDTSNNKMRAIFIPRNSWVPVDIYDQDEKYLYTRNLQLTLSHAVLLDTTAECAANTTKSVSYTFFNLPISYYIDVDQKVVKDASGAVGGVQVEALQSIPGQSFSAGETVLLEGESAYRYVQYRDIDVYESALDRQARQIQFVKAFISKLSGLSAQDILNLYNSVSDDVVTNIGFPEIAYLATCFVSGGNAEMEISSLTGSTEVAVESNEKEYERYYLDEKSVIQNTLDSFYVQID